MTTPHFLPTSSQLTRAKERSVSNPDNPDYFIQTDPRFTNYKNFISSDYMLLNVTNDATFKGATVRADNLDMFVGNDLNVESLRDEYSSNSNGYNISVGTSFGSDSDYTGKTTAEQKNLNNTVGVRTSSSIAGGNIGGGVNSGSTTSKQVVLTSITANNADITVGGNTNLKGSLIAAGYYDENGYFIDNGNLNLTTNTLTFSNLNSNTYSTNTSIGGGASLNQNKQGEVLPNASSVTYNASNGISYSKEKTLATIGSGDLTITDKDNSDDITKLNRDTSKIDKELYSGGVSSDVSATIDMRMFTEDGRKDIDDDIEDAGLLLKTIAQLGDDSVSFIGDKANGETGFFQSVEDKMALKAASEKFSSNPDNAEYIEALKNSNATPEEKQIALQAYHQAIADEMGVPVSQVAIIIDMANKGYTFKDGVFIADNLHQTNSDLTNTIANESSDVADLFRDGDIDKTDEYKTNRSEYSDNFGNLGEDLLNDSLYDNTGSNLEGVTNNHVGTNIYEPDEITEQVKQDTSVYQGLDKSQGAFRELSTKEKSFVLNEAAKQYASLHKGMSIEEARNILMLSAKALVDGVAVLDMVYEVNTSKLTYKQVLDAQKFLLRISKGITYYDSLDKEQRPLFDSHMLADALLPYNPSDPSTNAYKIIATDVAVTLVGGKILDIAGKPISRVIGNVYEAGGRYFTKLKNGKVVEVDKATANQLQEVYHYTAKQWGDSIKQKGLWEGSYVTPNGNLSGIGAKLELSLSPTKNAPEIKITIDLDAMRKAGFEIPTPTRVSNVVTDSTGRTYSMPGGGWEIQFPYKVPAEFIKEVAPI